jgi:hypothetical protein
MNVPPRACHFLVAQTPSSDDDDRYSRRVGSLSSGKTLASPRLLFLEYRGQLKGMRPAACRSGANRVRQFLGLLSSNRTWEGNPKRVLFAVPRAGPAATA